MGKIVEPSVFNQNGVRAGSVVLAIAAAALAGKASYISLSSFHFKSDVWLHICHPAARPPMQSFKPTFMILPVWEQREHCSEYRLSILAYTLVHISAGGASDDGDRSASHVCWDVAGGQHLDHVHRWVRNDQEHASPDVRESPVKALPPALRPHNCMLHSSACDLVHGTLGRDRNTQVRTDLVVFSSALPCASCAQPSCRAGNRVKYTGLIQKSVQGTVHRHLGCCDSFGQPSVH